MFRTSEGLRVPVDPAGDAARDGADRPGQGSAHVAWPLPLRARGAASRLPFASTSVGGGGPERKEGRTGVAFPHEFCHTRHSDCPILVGFGSRRKRLMGVKNIDVYAVGLYVDQQAARELLGPARGQQSAAALEADQGLLDEVVVADGIQKTLRIVVTSGLVTHDRFLSGLKDSLVPACRKVGDERSLAEFERLFEGVAFHRGLEMAFTSTQAGGLAARIGANDVGEIQSKAFTQAFFGLYLGREPVSADGKASMSKGLAGVLAEGAG